MRMMELINCICNVIRAIYPIMKDLAHAARKKKADQRSAADRNSSKEQG